MSDEPRVAILGSCITRDLWPVRGDAAGICYVSRTSLPSLFATPVADFKADSEPPAGLKANPHRALVADLTKTSLARLVAFRPTHLILDLIDERFDLLATGDSLVSGSWELSASGYLRLPALAGASRISRLSGGCDLLWLNAARQLAQFIAATPLRETRVILHSARWASHYRNKDGHTRPLLNVELAEGEPADIEAHNSLLRRYEDGLMNALGPVGVVHAQTPPIADEQHAWGLSPFHYAEPYNEEIWRQLVSFGVPRPV